MPGEPWNYTYPNESRRITAWLAHYVVDTPALKARIAELEAALLGAEIALTRDQNIDAAVAIILAAKR